MQQLGNHFITTNIEKCSERLAACSIVYMEKKWNVGMLEKLEKWNVGLLESWKNEPACWQTGEAKS